MAVPLKYSLIRAFPSLAAYQPIPLLNGERVGGMDAFKTQAEAAYAVVVFHRALGLASVAHEEQCLQELAKPQYAGRQEEVARKVHEFIAIRKLTRAAIPESPAGSSGAPLQTSTEAPAAPALAASAPAPAAGTSDAARPQRQPARK